MGDRPHLEWLSSFVFLPVADIVADSLQDLGPAVELTRVGDIDRLQFPLLLQARGWTNRLDLHRWPIAFGLRHRRHLREFEFKV